MNKTLARFALSAALAAAALPCFAQLRGTVVSIQDGDTLEVLVNKTPVRVRLSQIDAPERRQAFGTRARQALADQVFQEEVEIVVEGNDRYGRTLGRVIHQGRDINIEMVQLGMAWAYDRYVTDVQVQIAEQRARAARRGLWRDEDPVPPWQFRRKK
ncbi:MAG: micrococcal nuclease [Hydrogenophilales bacterium RIFOXYD1_FULL_62_11]|nr:MAG: micrococcal nuclease [Hydrogenophilales bacterium RIFOXYD1_FULL_62_11]